jgi:alpha-glucosidase
MLFVLLGVALLTARAVGVYGRLPSPLQKRVLSHQFAEDATTTAWSLNVSSCPGAIDFQQSHKPVYSTLPPGYTLHALQNTKTGLAAQLSLAGPACNAFGNDISNLTIEVTYESETR